MSIAGKVVLITGGARGMGREMVRAFLKEGAKVIATDISWAPTGLSNDDFDFLAEIKDHPNVITGVMDVMLQSHVDDIYEEAMEKFGTIDVIINNGGPRQPLIYLRKGGIVSILEPWMVFVARDGSVLVERFTTVGEPPNAFVT